MPKKCIICDGEAVYRIKDNADFYCEDCAAENFSDMSYLQKMQEQAVQLRDVIRNNLNQDNE